jgi:DNA-binding winged helix-turn-helix (wHTH) protein
VHVAFGNFQVSTDTQELLRDGVPVHVEPQVFAVLRHLIEHRDRVVSKIELLDEIWGSRFVSESALTSRIKSARQACDDNGHRQAVIRTVHGTGYRFVAELDSTDRPAVGTTATPTRPAGGLVGRRGELAEVEGVVERAAAGLRSAAFVTGPAGIGKSTFLAAMVERIDDEHGWQLLRGQSMPPRGAVEPYFPILDALSRAARAGNTAVTEALNRVAPMWLAQIPALIEPEAARRLEQRLLGTNPERMLREGAELLEELARHAPVALVLEDLHWADQCSLDVLDLTLQRSEPCRLIVLASARDEPSPVLDLVRSRRGAGHAAHIELHGLEDGDLDRLVIDSVDAAHVSDELLDIVRRRSNGVPRVFNLCT